MDGLFRRLQEVAELPNEGTPHAAASPTADLPRSEMEEELRSAKAAAAAAEAEMSAVKAEASELQAEYAAFKLKVQTWRAQARESRAQDRKTIDALRAAQGERTTAGAAESDAAYTASLEEQVHALKETVRSHATERDALVLETERLRARVQAELTAPPVSTPESGGVASDELLAMKARCDTLAAQLQDDAAAALTQRAALQQRCERLEQEAEEAERRFGDTLAAQERRVRELEAVGSKTAQSTYIGDLETELRQYRSQVTALTQRLEAGAAAGPAQPDESDAPPPVVVEPEAAPGETLRRVAQLEATIQELTEALADRTHELQREADRYEGLAAEAAARDETLDSVFMEARELRDELRAALHAAEAARSEVKAAREAAEMAHDEAAEVTQRFEAQQAQLEAAQRTATRLQSELAAKADQLRAAKLRELQAATNTAQVQQALAPAPKSAPAPQPASAVEQLGLVTWWVFWQRAWSSPRLRSYAVAGVLLLFMTLFVFSQSTAIHEDAHQVDLLRRCHEVVRMATLRAKQAGTDADVGSPRPGLTPTPAAPTAAVTTGTPAPST